MLAAPRLPLLCGGMRSPRSGEQQRFGEAAQLAGVNYARIVAGGQVAHGNRQQARLPAREELVLYLFRAKINRTFSKSFIGPSMGH